MPKVSALPPITSLATDDENPAKDTSTGSTGKWTFATLKTWLQSLTSWITPAMQTNPYKFSVYRNASWTTSTGPGKVQFDTEVFDTNSNFDSSTNYRYTAPVDGYYQIDACVGASSVAGSNGYAVFLYKNGSVFKHGAYGVTGNATFGLNAPLSTLVHLTAGDYLEIYFFGNSFTGGTGQALTYFEGHLVSET